MAIEVRKTSAPQQANGTMDYDDFIKTLKYLLDASWGKNWGKFVPDAPNDVDPNNVDYPIILHYINEMRPGLIGNSTRETKPRYRYHAVNPNANGNQPPGSTIYGQVFDVEVVFEVWEETNAKVEAKAKEFRQTLASFVGYLKEKGLKEIQFLKMVPKYESTLRDAHKVRALSYLVRFEELTEVPTDIFRVFDVVNKQLQDETVKR